MSTRSAGALLALTLLLVTAPPLLAQEAEGETSGDAEMAAMMEAYEKAATPGPQHEALATMTGDWKATVKMWMDPSGEPTVIETTSKVRPILGGRYVQQEVEGTFMGKPFHGLGVVGYENVTGQVKGIWIDDHSTTLYTYTGSLSEAGDRITMRGKHKDPGTGAWVETRAVTEIVSESRMVDRSYETRDGTERKVMEIVYERQM